MEHHLGFWPIPLTERPQPLGRGKGVGGTFREIISLREVAKSSNFVSCWRARPQANGQGRLLNGERSRLAENCATRAPFDSSNLREAQ